MCKRPKSGNTRGRSKFTGRVGMRRINLIERDDNQSDESTGAEEDNMVSHIGGNGQQPFIMKGKNKQSSIRNND